MRKKILKKLEDMNIEVLLYKRYVDDINIIFVAPDTRSEYITNDQGRGQLIINNERKIGKEENAMIMLQKVGNNHPQFNPG